MKDKVFKTKMKTQVNKDIPCSEYIGKPVTNGLGEIIGKVINAIELDKCIEITMELEIPIPLAKPFSQSISFSNKELDE